MLGKGNGSDKICFRKKKKGVKSYKRIILISSTWEDQLKLTRLELNT